MKDIDIRKALIERFLTLNEFSGIEFIKDNVSEPNITFIEPADKRYFKLSFMPAEPEQIGMYNCNQQRYSGLFQIDICTPKGSGEDEADNKFSWISKLFLEGTSFNGVDIDKVYKAIVIEEENLFRTVVRINFTADVNNE